MSSIEIREWKNKLLEVDLLTIKIGREFWFFGKEVGLSLEYKDPKEAIRDHVDERDKKTIKELLGLGYKTVLQQNFLMGDNLSPIRFFQSLHPDYKVIKEIGLYSLCVKSRKKKVVPFQRWIYETIQEIRETGSYALPGGAVKNPLDLVAKIQTLERKIESIQSKTKTCDKSTQTRKSVMVVEDSFKELENKMKKSLKKTKSSLEKSIREARFDLEKSIREVKFDLEKSFKEISPSSSRSSSPQQSSSNSE